MTTIALSVEGVLANHPPGSDLLNHEATGAGRTLYSILKPTCRIMLLTSDPHEDRVKAWLMRERFSKYTSLYTYEAEKGLSPEAWKVWKINDLISMGHHIGFFISGDPSTVKGVLESGVNSILLATSGVNPGSPMTHESDYTSWYDLVESIEEQNVLKASKEAREDG